MDTNKKINPQARRSKQWLTESLLALMQEKEYDKITVTEIVKNADLSRFAYYRHFNSKNDILLEHIDRIFDVFFDRLGKLEKLSRYEFIYQLTLIFEENVTFFQLMSKINRVDLVKSRLEENYQRIWDAWLGRPANIHTEQYDYYISYFSNAAVGMLMKWIDKKERESAEYIADLILKFRTIPDIHDALGF